MKKIFSIVIILISITIIVTTFIQPLPCSNEEELEKKECSYLIVYNEKINNHTKYKLFFYLYPILAILCIILSIINYYKK